MLFIDFVIGTHVVVVCHLNVVVVAGVDVVGVEVVADAYARIVDVPANDVGASTLVVDIVAFVVNVVDIDFDVVATTLVVAVNDVDDASTIAIGYIYYVVGTSDDVVFHVYVVIVIVVVVVAIVEACVYVVVAHANPI